MKILLVSIVLILNIFISCSSNKQQIIDAPLLQETNIVIPSGAIEVTIKKTSNGFTVVRAGKPYYINGVGFNQKSEDDYYHLKLLADLGGNSIRTWGVKDIQRSKKLLDKAYAFGVTVDFGLWVDHERHGFDYNNAQDVEKRFQHFKKIVNEFKDHPALLMWNIGNEVTVGVDDYNKKVFNFIGKIAEMIHEVDGKHPTTTTIHIVNKNLIDDIKERAPGIDILGINRYSGVEVAVRDAIDNGWDKPLVVTEFGTSGEWEVQKTKWGAPIEPYGIEKAILYKRSIRSLLDINQCIGAYAFLWGEYQTVTKSWYTLIFNRGRTIPAVDELIKAWTGKYPENRAPFIQTFKINGLISTQSVVVKTGEELTVSVIAKDTEDKNSLIYKWVLREEVLTRTQGGDFIAAPPVIPMKINDEDEGVLVFEAPSIPKQYRLFVTVYDSKGKICAGNFPFLIE